MRTSKVIEVETRYLKHHPANPRKDLGDLTELVDSIEAQGVLQNLTIVPTDLWDLKEDAIDDSFIETIREEIEGMENGGEPNDDFYVLIGNRRFEAAEEAGLEKVPCRIVNDISKDEQVSMMLLENIQRNDLTIQEQAKGFQMMIDLGETAEGIAEKTGFSQATVYHRLNIAKLDDEILDDALSKRQLTLTELMELERVSDIEARNKILSTATDIKWAVQRYLEDMEKQEKIDSIIAAISKTHTINPLPEGAKTWQNEWKQVESQIKSAEVDTSGWPDEELFYTTSWEGNLYVWYHCDEPEEEDDEESEEEKRIAEMKERLFDLNEIVSDLMETAVLHIVRTSKNLSNIERETLPKVWTFVIDENVSLPDSPFSELFDFADEHFEGDILKPEMEEEEYESAVKEWVSDLRADLQMLILILENLTSWRHEVFKKYPGTYCKADGELFTSFFNLLEDVYDFEQKDKEIDSFLRGTHEYFGEV